MAGRQTLLVNKVTFDVELCIALPRVVWTLHTWRKELETMAQYGVTVGGN